MGITTDRNDPGLQTIRADGQQESYLVLSEEERAKGYVLPVRRKYTHVVCGTKTTMPQACAETYSRNPKFYSGTFCCACGTHFDLTKWNEATQVNEPQFLWWPDGDPVGADAEEAHVFLKAKVKHDLDDRVRYLGIRRDDLKAQLTRIEEEILKAQEAIEKRDVE